MINEIMKWAAVAGIASDNSTKFQEINDLVAVVLKKETLCKGVVPASIDQTLTKNKLFQALKLFGMNGALIGQLRCLAMINFDS